MVAKGKAPPRKLNAAEKARQATRAASKAKKVATTTSPFNVNLSSPEKVLESEFKFQNPNETSDYGSKRTIIGPDGRPSVEYTLSPEQKAILNKQQGTELGVQDAFRSSVDRANVASAQPIDFSRLQNVDIQNDASRKAVEDAYLQRQNRLLEPEIEKVRNSQIQNLRDRGIPFGSPQWNEQVNNIDTQINRQREDLANNAILQGRGEAESMFNRQLQGRQQGISEIMTQRDRPLQEAGAFAGFRSGVTNPNFQPYNAPNVGAIADREDTQAFELDRMKRDQAFTKSMQRGGGGGGGGRGFGATPAPSFDRVGALADMFAQESQPKPKKPSVFGQLGSAILGQGIGALGNSLGSSLGGLLKF